MIRVKLLIFATVFLNGCLMDRPAKDLLSDPARWTGEEAPQIVDSTWLVEGEYKSWHYKPGFLQTYENFELTADIMTYPGAVAAIFFHTTKRDPAKGYEVRIDNSPVGNWSRLLKSGSLSSIRNINYTMARDEEWFELRIRVEENQVRIYLNDYPLVSYIEGEDPYRTIAFSKRMLGSGTFRIETLYDHTKLAIRNLRLKKLPKGKIKKDSDPEFSRQITQLNIRKIPVVDYHVHIKGDLTMSELIDTSSALGINYGIAANCGLNFPVQTDEQLEAYLKSIEGLPIFTAMQAEGREWTSMFSPELVERFDYVFTDAMTWTNSKGKRMRLWIPQETEVGDPEEFMEELLAQIEKILTEPISIYVNPSYLPAEIAQRYEELWTDERIDRVIRALKENNVALEINSRLQLPGERFIIRAREEGVKFAMGTNNTSSEDLGRLDWSLNILNKYDLQVTDMFLPGANSGK